MGEKAEFDSHDSSGTQSARDRAVHGSKDLGEM
jgi:hypothetical protein